MTEPPSRLSTLARLPSSKRRVLDFDLETVAAGFADPDWVPQTVTAWAACWTDESEVRVEALSPALFYDIPARRRFLEPLVALVREAGVVTGHNILRFDLPVLQADVMRVGLPSLPPVLAQDTIRLPRSKGFKKGQDVLASMLDVREEKLPLHWGAWAAAYAEDSLATVKDRVVGDVRQHMQLREAMRDRGWLTAPRVWKP